MAISKVGQRRQVVISKELCDAYGIVEGEFVEVLGTSAGVLIKAKKLVDLDDVLTPEEEKIVRKAERQAKRGQVKSWQKVKNDLGL